MKTNPLGRDGPAVTVATLGTMTFGRQNTEAEAHDQLDLALERGVNLVDAAEMYPVPAAERTHGFTERYVGSWLAKGRRDRVMVATKITGPGRKFAWMRDGRQALTEEQIVLACEGSLARLGTDYLDLYQLHWPSRNVPKFGGWSFDPAAEVQATPVDEQLGALDRLVRAGKVRRIGLSNETPWGVMSFLAAVRGSGLARVASVQNAYNLLNRVAESGLSEVLWREQVGMLAYSPLAFGYLTGKYRDGVPARSRVGELENFGARYSKPGVAPAVAAYCALAASRGLSPVQLALGFVASRPFVTSTIVGATSRAQLVENLDAIATPLDRETLDAIDRIHLLHTNPAP
ncbi:MAG TPA: aldo/keto reductase [Usitatibacteraceae bacterium]|nr:aldo/keto reductase [Usitatibacteraceae bacterium]